MPTKTFTLIKFLYFRNNYANAKEIGLASSIKPKDVTPYISQLVLKNKVKKTKINQINHYILTNNGRDYARKYLESRGEEINEEQTDVDKE